MPASATGGRSATGSRPTSRASGCSTRDGHARDRTARRRRVARSRDHDHRRLQLLGCGRGERPTSSGCARSSTSRCSAPTPREAETPLRASCGPASRRPSSCGSAISPHAPYTCSVDAYRCCLSLGIPVGTHLAESDGENEWLEHGTGPLPAAATSSSSRPGSAPSRRSRRSRPRAPLRRIASTLDAGEIALLAERRRARRALPPLERPARLRHRAARRAARRRDPRGTRHRLARLDAVVRSLGRDAGRRRRARGRASGVPDALDAADRRCTSLRSVRRRARARRRDRQPHPRQTRRHDRRLS